MFCYEEGFVYLADVIDILYTIQSAKKKSLNIMQPSLLSLVMNSIFCALSYSSVN